VKPLVVIPARGGSKGVPRKNIKLLGQVPLIYYTLDAAREVCNDKHIYVSTDDLEIKEVVEKTGLIVPFLRPQHLSTDTSGTNEVLLHAIEFAELNKYYPDTIILLQPTSPFRTSQHIKESLAMFDHSIDMVVSVKETRSNPYYVLFEENEEGYLMKSKQGMFTRRQDCPKVWEYNGAVYIINVTSIKRESIQQFKKIKKYIMDDQSSHDIDTITDWQIAELLLGNRNQQ
jgi:CMP-N,N'-diacetyllegionaminic acid synthase